MSPQAAWQKARHARIQTLGLFAALGMIGGAFVVPVMAQQATNQAPVAQPDTVSTAEDTAITVTVLANDTDPDGNTLTVTGLVSPTHGTAVINGGTTVTYTPAANYVGVDTFAYTVSDGQGGAAVGTVIITVTAANDPPVAVADTATVSVATSIAVLTNDIDPDGDTLTITAVTQGAHGTVGSSAGGVVTYTPTPGYSGQDVFTYTVSDGNGGTAVGTVTVTVSAVAVNRAPVAVGDSATIQQDTSKVISVLTNDTDPDGDSLTVTTATPAAHGTVAMNANGTVTYTPVAGYVGQDIFTYTVRDPGGLTAIGTVTMTVTAKVVTPPAQSGDKDLCKDYLWKLLGFKNQGQCIAAANQVSNEGDGDERYIALALALLSDRQLSGSNVRNILNGQVTVLTMKPIIVIQPVIVQQVITVKPPIIANGGGNNSQAVISYLEKSKADEKVNAALQAKAEAQAKADALKKSSRKH